MSIEWDEDYDEDNNDEDIDEPVTFVPTATFSTSRPENRHVKVESLARHARCSICELAAQSHPHQLCELTPQQVAATQAEPDAIRKYHLERAKARDQLRRRRR